MDRFMYLFDFEFKRNLKSYIKIISIFCFLFIWEIVCKTMDYNRIIEAELKTKSLDVLTQHIGNTSFSNILSTYDNSDTYLLTGLIVCIGYSILIWRKDFLGNNKSIYTLVMLPQDRMKIYASKFFNILSLIYMYVISFTVCLYMSYIIVPFFMKGDVKNLGFINETIYQFSMLIPYNIEVFLVVYVFLISAIISILFTLSINKNTKLNKFKWIIKTIVFGILSFMFLFFSYEIEYYMSKYISIGNYNLFICVASFIIIVLNLIICKIKLSNIDF